MGKERRSSKGRSKERVGEELLEKLVKRYVVEDPSIDTSWMSWSPGDTIKHLRPMLAEVASETERLNKSSIKTAILKIWPMNLDCADLWALKVAKAFSVCATAAYNKKDNRQSGARYDPHTQVVVDVFLANESATKEDDEEEDQLLEPPKKVRKQEPSSPSPSPQAAASSSHELSMWDSPVQPRARPIDAAAHALIASPSALWNSPMPVKTEKVEKPVKAEALMQACFAFLHMSSSELIDKCQQCMHLDSEAKAKPVKAVVPDWNSFQIVRLVDGVESKVPMQPGPKGFVQGVFDDETCTLETSNIHLAHLQALKAGKKESKLSKTVKKKPSSKIEKDDDEEEFAESEHDEVEEESAAEGTDGGDGKGSEKPEEAAEAVFEAPRCKQA